MDFKRVVLTSALFSLLAACGGASITFVRSQPPPHPMTAKSVESVAIFQAPPADRKYVEVGRIEVSFGMTNTDGLDTARTKVRAKAAEVGCDGLIEGGVNQMMSATCIVFTDGKTS